MTIRRWWGILATSAGLALLAAATAGRAAAADEGGAGKRQAEQDALKPWGGLVGSWRGTGQPRRGQAAGAWTEAAGWAWKLTADSAALEIEVQKGKYLKAAELRPGAKPGEFGLDATLADGSKRSFRGRAEPGKPLVLIAEGDAPAEGVGRITLTVPNDLRFLLLLESAGPAGGPGARLGEVGYTRNGARFAAGESGPACIVTEGRGTIPVTYQGKKYYVCCSGCRELFEENPAAILAEAEARAAKKGK